MRENIRVTPPPPPRIEACFYSDAIEYLPADPAARGFDSRLGQVEIFSLYDMLKKMQHDQLGTELQCLLRVKEDLS